MALAASASGTAPQGTTPETDSVINDLFDKAFEATSHGDFASAETLWTEILEHYPNNAAVWSNRGNARVSQHKLHDLEGYSEEQYPWGNF